MTILLSQIVSRNRMVAVHTPLGAVEWPGTIEHIEATLGERRPDRLFGHLVKGCALDPPGARSRPVR